MLSLDDMQSGIWSNTLFVISTLCIASADSMLRRLLWGKLARTRHEDTLAKARSLLTAQLTECLRKLLLVICVPLPLSTLLDRPLVKRRLANKVNCTAAVCHKRAVKILTGATKVYRKFHKILCLRKKRMILLKICID